MACSVEHYPQFVSALGAESKAVCYVYSTGTRNNGNSLIYSGCMLAASSFENTRSLLEVTCTIAKRTTHRKSGLGLEIFKP